jgi:outer membrane receptor for ferrienterochelin and colicins
MRHWAMKNIRLYTSLFIFLGFILSVSVQGQSVLRVADALTREPLAGATIRLGTQGGGYTDTIGVFVVPQTATEITISYPGYTTWTGAFSPLVLLEPADQSLAAVVISATMKEITKEASPIPVEVYSPRFFQKNATATFFDAMNSVNGVRPQITCNVCNTGSIQINGLAGPYTMVTIDGMPIVSGLSTVYGLSGIPNGIVERIEVVKGPASTLYGSEAVGGMINIVTKNALNAPTLYADVFATSAAEYNVDASVAGRLKKAYTMVGANFFNFQKRLDINKDNFTDMTLQRRFSVFNKWHFDRKKDRVASLALRYVDEERWGGELNWTPEWRGTDSIYGESIFTRRVEVLGRYQLPWDAQKVMLDVSWNRHFQDSYYGVTPYIASQQVGFAQLSAPVAVGTRHDVLLGAAYRYTVYNDNTPATSTGDGLRDLPNVTTLPGLFVQDEFKINQRNTLLSGLRYDYNSAHGHILTPRLSWKWAEDAQHILRVTAGSGYRVANIFTEDHAALTGARTVVIEENLQPERSWNANINYVTRFFPARAGYIGLDASAFFTRFSNQIVPDYLTDPDKIIFANLNGYGISGGVSVNTDFNFTNGIKILLGATAMQVYRVEDGERLPQLFAPPLSGTWTATFPVKKWGLSLDYTGNVNSPMHLPVFPNDERPAQSPWYAIHNVQVTKEIVHDVELYVGVKNLLGFYPQGNIILRAFDPFDKYVHLNNPNNFTFDPTYSYAPVQRQRLLVGIRWNMH